MKEELKIVGCIEEYIDGELIRKRSNSIQTEFKERFRSALGAGVYGIGVESSNLFTTANLILDYENNDQYTRDGIAVKDDINGGNWYTMDTSQVGNSPTGYGVQWKGTMVSDVDRSIIKLLFGKTSGGGTTSPFTTPYALIDKTSNPLAISTNQIYEVIWNIYIP